MRRLLEPGTTAFLRDYPDVRCHIEELLGQGGQGEVYRARVVPRHGSPEDVAVKWYYPQWDTPEQRRALEELTARSAPHPCFLWPMHLVGSDRPGFGYLMKLREPRFRGVNDVMRGAVDISLRHAVTAAAALSDAFLCLHSLGLCYRDINFGNVFLDPANGEIRVADNDNVGIDGRASAGVRGTERFMAPEVVRGGVPSTTTDLYSLSVLLFHLLFFSHPLDGRRETEIALFDRAAGERLYGTDPLFIFDPDDRSNAPVPGVHDNALALWPLYPGWVRRLFVRAFTDGLRDPVDGRVRESEWRAAMSTLRDHVLECAGCGAEAFWDREQPDGPRCWRCGNAVPQPTRLELRSAVGRETVLAKPGAALFAHHLRVGPHDWTVPLAVVVPHPEHPGVLGLENRTAVTWNGTTPHHETVPVPPGRRVRLTPGLRLDTGAVSVAVVR